MDDEFEDVTSDELKHWIRKAFERGQVAGRREVLIDLEIAGRERAARDAIAEPPTGERRR